MIDYALNDRGVGLDAARAAWTSMITACRQKNIKVILCTPTGDTAARRNDPNDALVQHTEQIKRLTAELWDVATLSCTVKGTIRALMATKSPKASSLRGLPRP